MAFNSFFFMLVVYVLVYVSWTCGGVGSEVVFCICIGVAARFNINLHFVSKPLTKLFAVLQRPPHYIVSDKHIHKMALNMVFVLMSHVTILYIV